MLYDLFLPELAAEHEHRVRPLQAVAAARRVLWAHGHTSPSMLRTTTVPAMSQNSSLRRPHLRF